MIEEQTTGIPLHNAMDNVAQETEIKLHQTMDAKVWTEEFLRIAPDSKDFGTMVGWFANALMVGWDHACYKFQPRLEEASSRQLELQNMYVALENKLQAARHHVIGHKGNAEILAELDSALELIRSKSEQTNVHGI